MTPPAPPQFSDPQSIHAYGRMVEGFNRAMKAVPKALDAANVNAGWAEPIAGEGPYNALKAEEGNYVRYGAQETAAGRGVSQGMFGAFGILHLPELQLSKHAPVLAGKQGCRLRHWHAGMAYDADLGKAKFDFVVHGKPQDEYGEIVLAEALRFTAADGQVQELPAGTVLARRRTWLHEGAQPLFAITDPGGTPLPPVHTERHQCDAGILLLWSHLTALGFKRWGRDSPEFNVLARDGVDDDFNAEQAMVDWLNVLRSVGVDLMPAFNSYVARASAALQQRPDMLQAMADAKALAREAKKGEVLDSKSLEYPSHHARYAHRALRDDVPDGVDGCCTMLGLSLPAPSVEPGLAEHYRGQMQRHMGARQLRDAQHQKLLAPALPHPFDAAWAEAPDATMQQVLAGADATVRTALGEAFDPVTIQALMRGKAAVAMQPLYEFAVGSNPLLRFDKEDTAVARNIVQHQGSVALRALGDMIAGNKPAMEPAEATGRLEALIAMFDRGAQAAQGRGVAPSRAARKAQNHAEKYVAKWQELKPQYEALLAFARAADSAPQACGNMYGGTGVAEVQPGRMAEKFGNRPQGARTPA